MGFLSIKSNTLTWDESKQEQNQIKYYGVLQAIKLYETFKDIHKKMDDLKWGEEIEYNVGTLCRKDSSAKIVIEGYDKVLEALKGIQQDEFMYQAEFGSWMVEAIPNKPYVLYDIRSPAKALDLLIRRRQLINDEIFMQGLFMNTLSSWPNLGVKDFFQTDNNELYKIENYEEHNTASKSCYMLDDMTNTHPRFPAMMANTRNKRGKKVDIRVPLYRDVNTGIGKIDGHITPGEIYMDSQHFGMGC
jgi:glutamate--cysteine ligase catalytic subunit